MTPAHADKSIPPGTRVLVSACLLGLTTRYKGNTKPSSATMEYIAAQQLIPIPVCPEQLGGLPTPRAPSSFVRGDGHLSIAGTSNLVDTDGCVTTPKFLHGARQCMEIARICQCEWAIFKERSPSCGVHQVFQGENLIDGQGVTCAMLHQAGINVLSDEEVDTALKR